MYFIRKKLTVLTLCLLVAPTMSLQVQASNLSDSKTIIISAPVDQMIKINGLQENLTFGADSGNDGNNLSEDLSFTVGRRGSADTQYQYTVLLSADGGYQGDFFRLNNTSGEFLRMQVSYYDENTAGTQARPEIPITNQVTSESLNSANQNARLVFNIPLEDIDDAAAGNYSTNLNLLVSVQ